MIVVQSDKYKLSRFGLNRLNTYEIISKKSKFLLVLEDKLAEINYKSINKRFSN
jgi:hypothetical protein